MLDSRVTGCFAQSGHIFRPVRDDLWNTKRDSSNPPLEVFGGPIVKLSKDNPPQVGDWFLVGGKKAVFTREDSPHLHPQVSWADGGLLGKFLEKDWLDMEVTRPPKKVTGELVGVVPVGADRYITWYCPVGDSSKIHLPTNDAYAVIRLPKEDN